jgi:bla regulator protein BlaR1
VATPSLHGWLRPTLLLPRGFLVSFTREQLRYVVLHELAHLRRSDVLVNWIATAAQVLHWFNPLVRLAVMRLAEERELNPFVQEALDSAPPPASRHTT